MHVLENLLSQLDPHFVSGRTYFPGDFPFSLAAAFPHSYDAGKNGWQGPVIYWHTYLDGTLQDTLGNVKMAIFALD